MQDRTAKIGNAGYGVRVNQSNLSIIGLRATTKPIRRRTEKMILSMNQ